MFIGNIKHDAINSWLRFHKSVTVMKVFRSLTSHPKLAYSMRTCSWPLSVLWYSCFIPQLNYLVVIPHPESSLSVNMQVGRKIVGAKIEIVNCLLVVCAHKWRFKIVFRKLNCSTTTKAMGHQMYFYYLEWLFTNNHITVLLFLNNQNIKLVIYK